MVEFRLDQLEADVREIKQTLGPINDALTRIETTIDKGLATRTHLLYVALGLVGTLVVVFLTVYFHALKSLPIVG